MILEIPLSVYDLGFGNSLSNLAQFEKLGKFYLVEFQGYDRKFSAIWFIFSVALRILSI